MKRFVSWRPGWRHLAYVLFASFSIATLVSRPAPIPAAAAPAVQVQAVGPIGLTVSDMDRAVEFYSKVLSFKQTSDVEVAGDAYERLQGVFGLRMRVVRMRLGDETVELTEYLAPRGRSIPEDLRSNDRSFQHVAIIVSDMDKAYQWLRRHKVAHASTGPQRLPDWNRNAGGIEAFYFRDPDGHFLEILSFPSGKGLAKWHRSQGRLFLGIDHTAIVVASTEASLGFYRDRLGLARVGGSDNHGTEQEHLNNVAGARLRITTLRAPEGPGIELLEYLAPRNGRPMPKDERANDLIHWQTRLTARRLDGLTRSGMTFVSSGVVTLPDQSLGFGRAALVRDPDGHVMEIVE